MTYICGCSMLRRVLVCRIPNNVRKPKSHRFLFHDNWGWVTFFISKKTPGVKNVSLLKIKNLHFERVSNCDIGKKVIRPFSPSRTIHFHFQKLTRDLPKCLREKMYLPGYGEFLANHRLRR